jgi:D-alanine-D-alanine ligase
MDKKKIAVIFGGVSVEHDVSIITAHQVIKAIDITLFEVIPVYISLQGLWYSDECLLKKETFKNKADIDKLPTFWMTPFRNDLNLYSEISSLGGLSKKKKSVPFDVAFPLVHGSNGEDGTLQGLFKLKNIPFVGSDTKSSAVCMSKYLTKQIAHHNSIDVLPCTYIEVSDWFAKEKDIINMIEGAYAYPLIVKPNSLGSSIGVKVANNQEELAIGIDNALKIDTAIIVEPKIIDMIEINCAILDGEKRIISRTEQPVSGGGLLDFEIKYLKGGKGKKTGRTGTASPNSRGMEDTPRVIPAPVDEKIIEKVEEYSEVAFDVIGCSGVVRIDYIYDTKKDRLYLNELNTIPGSLAYYLFKDLDIGFTELTTKLINNAFRIHSIKSRKKFDYKSGLF